MQTLVVSNEQDVHIEVEHVRDGEEQRLLHLGLGHYPDEQVLQRRPDPSA